MRNIIKQPEPQSLTEHRAMQFADYENYQQKDELRVSLVREQRGLCCYCLRSISAEGASMKIEHWHCRDNYPAEQLDYANLLAACKGGEKQDLRAEDRHCDTSKGNRDLCLNPANSLDHVEQTISYLPDGRIRSSNSAFNDELTSVLNINGRTLTRARKLVVQNLLSSYPRRSNRTSEEWREIAREWSGELNESELRQFSPVVVFYIRKYILREVPNRN